jgi:hypothetical protein
MKLLCCVHSDANAVGQGPSSSTQSLPGRRFLADASRQVSISLQGHPLRRLGTSEICFDTPPQLQDPANLAAIDVDSIDVGDSDGEDLHRASRHMRAHDIAGIKRIALRCIPVRPNTRRNDQHEDQGADARRAELKRHRRKRILDELEHERLESSKAKMTKSDRPLIGPRDSVDVPIPTMTGHGHTTPSSSRNRKLNDVAPPSLLTLHPPSPLPCTKGRVRVQHTRMSNDGTTPVSGPNIRQSHSSASSRLTRGLSHIATMINIVPADIPKIPHHVGAQGRFAKGDDDHTSKSPGNARTAIATDTLSCSEGPSVQLTNMVHKREDDQRTEATADEQICHWPPQTDRTSMRSGIRQSSEIKHNSGDKAQAQKSFSTPGIAGVKAATHGSSQELACSLRHSVTHSSLSASIRQCLAIAERFIAQGVTDGSVGPRNASRVEHQSSSSRYTTQPNSSQNTPQVSTVYRSHPKDADRSHPLDLTSSDTRESLPVLSSTQAD